LQMNKEVNLIFQFKDSSFLFQPFFTDSSGSFEIDGALFADTVKVFYMLNSKKGSAKNVHILFEQNNQFKKLLAPLPSSPYLLLPRQAFDSADQALGKALNAQKNQREIESRYINLQEVIVRAKKASAKEQLSKKYSSPLFQSFNEYVFDFENENQQYGGAGDVVDWLRGRVVSFNSTDICFLCG